MPGIFAILKGHEHAARSQEAAMLVIWHEDGIPANHNGSLQYCCFEISVPVLVPLGEELCFDARLLSRQS